MRGSETKAHVHQLQTASILKYVEHLKASFVLYSFIFSFLAATMIVNIFFYGIKTRLHLKWLIMIANDTQSTPQSPPMWLVTKVEHYL